MEFMYPRKITENLFRPAIKIELEKVFKKNDMIMFALWELWNLISIKFNRFTIKERGSHVFVEKESRLTLV